MSMKRYDLSALTILVVEGSDQIRHLIAQMLRGFGVRNVIAVRNATAAQQALNQDPIDLVIADWAIQPTDGLDFVRTIRFAVNCSYRAVPILMMSGYSEEWRVTAARDAGVNEFLVKPISAKRLLQRILYMIEHPRPLIRTSTYYGPDRRRKIRTDYTGIERRRPEPGPNDQSPGGLTEAEVEALLRG